MWAEVIIVNVGRRQGDFFLERSTSFKSYIRGCSLLFVAARVCSWLFVVVRGCSFLFVAIRGCSLLFVAVRVLGLVFHRFPPWSREGAR